MMQQQPFPIRALTPAFPSDFFAAVKRVADGQREQGSAVPHGTAYMQTIANLPSRDARIVLTTLMSGWHVAGRHSIMVSEACASAFDLAAAMNLPAAVIAVPGTLAWVEADVLGDGSVGAFVLESTHRPPEGYPDIGESSRMLLIAPMTDAGLVLTMHLPVGVGTVDDAVNAMAAWAQQRGDPLPTADPRFARAFAFLAHALRRIRDGAVRWVPPPNRLRRVKTLAEQKMQSAIRAKWGNVAVVGA